MRAARQKRLWPGAGRYGEVAFLVPLLSPRMFDRRQLLSGLPLMMTRRLAGGLTGALTGASLASCAGRMAIS